MESRALAARSVLGALGERSGHGMAGTRGAEDTAQHSNALPGLSGTGGSTRLLHERFAALYHCQMHAFMSCESCFKCYYSLKHDTREEMVSPILTLKDALVMHPVLHHVPVRRSATRGTPRPTPVLPVPRAEQGCTLPL